MTLAVIDALEATDDVRNIIAVRGDELDWDYLRHWTTQHGSHALLEEIRHSIPPEP